MSSVFIAFWNRHKELKKTKNGNPSQCVIICDLVLRKNKKLIIRQIPWKSVLRNKLPRTKIHDFQAKWRMLWWHSWHSLFKYVHIIHKRASWNGDNVAEESFYFLWTKKSFFIFRVSKMGCFVKQLPKICFQIGSHKFYKIIYHILCTNNQIFVCQRFPYASHQTDKFLPIRLEPGQIWTTTAS